MRILLSLFLVVLHTFFVFAQEPENSNDVELLENIHLHLNKTTFLQGERLWFKAYVQDQKSKRPSLETSNLHVGIYSANGEEIKRKLFYVENGMAKGDFAIDSALVETEYTVLAWTNYMRNFKKLQPFRQQIKIPKEGIEENIKDVNMKISIFPEGGHLIAGAYNNIGILVNNGLEQGVAVNNLELVDETGKVVRSNIATNQFGIGKMGFMVEEGKSYYLQCQPPGLSIIKQKLPDSSQGQLGLNIDNNVKKEIFLKLMASKQTFSDKDGDLHTIALYQDDFLQLNDVEINEDEPVISFKRADMPYGPITTVLFNEEQEPIAYRMFFNHKEDGAPVKDLDIEHCLTEFGDSLQIDLSAPNITDQNVHLSISILPGNSRAYYPDNSIISTFNIRPYVRRGFQDGYYFQDQDRQKRFELDKRLLIEGWGKYDWDSRKLDSVKLEFEFEKGISFKGKVIDADLNEEAQISLVAELSGQLGFKELSSDKSFEENMLLYNGDSLGVSIISKKGKLRKPNTEITFNHGSKSISEMKGWLQYLTFEKQNNIYEERVIDEILNIGERTIALQEVVVTERTMGKKIPLFIPRGTLLPISEGRIIGDAEIKRYGSVMSYLAKLGYTRTTGIDRDGFIIDAILSPKSNTPVILSGNINLPLSKVQAIYFDVDKRVYVSIVLRSNPYEKPEDRNKFVKFLIEKGYSLPQEYFTPNYPDYDGAIFRNYGALYWKANISLGSEMPTSINIPIKNQNEILLYLEGMGYNGNLISEMKSIHLKE